MAGIQGLTRDLGTQTLRHSYVWTFDGCAVWRSYRELLLSALWLIRIWNPDLSSNYNRELLLQEGICSRCL